MVKDGTLAFISSGGKAGDCILTLELPESRDITKME